MGTDPLRPGSWYVEAIKQAEFRDMFPAIRTTRAGVDTAYMDNASMTLRPHVVLEALTKVYCEHYGNVHRGSFGLAEAVTAEYERARWSVARFFGAHESDLRFVRNCTEGLNAVAEGLRFGPYDEVLVSAMEHHSNLLPWRRKATTRIVPMKESGEVDLDRLEAMATSRTRVISITHGSNVTGVIQPIADVVRIARRVGALTVVDAAQTAGHRRVNMADLDCDFLTGSGHKIFGPTGAGVVVRGPNCDEVLQPTLWGGGMVSWVSHSTHAAKSAPHCYEAGTPSIEAAIGLAAAIKLIGRVENIEWERHTMELARKLNEGLKRCSSVRLLFPNCTGELPIVCVRPRNKSISGLELGTLLFQHYGIASRAGVFCCEPLFRSRGESDAVRFSLQFYNTTHEIDLLISALDDLAPILAA